MRDPHVEWLRYRILSPETTVYEDPEAITVNEDAFDARLDGGVLTATMREHFPEVAKARRVVEAFLQASEIKTDLEIRFGVMRFGYEHAHVVDRLPPRRGLKASNRSSARAPALPRS